MVLPSAAADGTARAALRCLFAARPRGVRRDDRTRLRLRAHSRGLAGGGRVRAALAVRVAAVGAGEQRLRAVRGRRRAHRPGG
eukprot:3482452-Prymnesium_polylepis.2